MGEGKYEKGNWGGQTSGVWAISHQWAGGREKRGTHGIGHVKHRTRDLRPGVEYSGTGCRVRAWRWNKKQEAGETLLAGKSESQTQVYALGGRAMSHLSLLHRGSRVTALTDAHATA
jgi:hypothetical protein